MLFAFRDRKPVAVIANHSTYRSSTSALRRAGAPASQQLVEAIHDSAPSTANNVATSRTGNFGHNRYTGPYESLETDPVLVEWLPKDQIGLNKLYRAIHQYDNVVGPAIDLMSSLPFSDCNLLGIQDKEVMRIYEETIDNLNPKVMMPELTSEFMTIGRVITSLIFNNKTGVFDSIVPHDPDYVFITPIPVRGREPKIDLMPSPEWKAFLNSVDPRDVDIREKLPESLQMYMGTGSRIPLEPEATMFIHRKASPYDYLGTSLLNRVIPFYALEKHLISGTLVAAKRRQRAILHIKAGKDGVWDPTQEEMESISGMFIAADEDPQGAVVVTRDGVEATEVRDGQNFWKISDEAPYLVEGKMRALGINEAFLSGDATYNTMEVALSVFIEQLKNLRATVEEKVWHRKIFPLLARVHGFVKIPQHELAHRVRIKKRPTQRTAFQYNYNDLLMPEIHWEKQLQPSADENYLTILATMEEKGIPVPIRMWAAAGGLNLDELIDQFDEDGKLRIQLKEWAQKTGFNQMDMMEEGAPPESGGFASITSLPVWDGRKLLGLGRAEATAAFKSFADNPKLLTNPAAAKRHLRRHFKGNKRKIAAMGYILTRIGAANIPQGDHMLEQIGNRIMKTGGMSVRERGRELLTLSQMSTNPAKGVVSTESPVTSENGKLSVKADAKVANPHVDPIGGRLKILGGRGSSLWGGHS